MGEAKLRHPAWAIQQVQRALAHPGWRHEHTIMQRLWRATKFVVDFRDLPPRLFEHAAEFGADLGRHGAFVLPYADCVFAAGPFMSSDTGEDSNFYGLPNSSIAAYFSVVLAWIDKGYIFFRSYRVPQHPSSVDRINPAMSTSRVGLGADPFSDGSIETRLDAEIEKHFPKEDVSNIARLETLCSLRTMLGMVGFLSTRGVERIGIGGSVPRVEQPPKTPSFAYYLLKARPPIARANGPCGSPVKHGIRLHWRRGHVRRRATGKLIIVRPHLVGDLARGVIAKDYILVGSAAAPAALTSEAAQ